MEGSSSLKLIIEKGPREGETLEYTSGTVVKVGRVLRGNTIGIKDAGISSKHISIQFDNDLSTWNLTDLDSSNGTLLNGEALLPNVPSPLNDGDCIKIGELTSIIVKIGGVQSTIRPQRNPRRQAKAAVAETERNGLGLGLDGDLGETAVEEPVPKRNLRSRAKKTVDSNNEVENLNPRRTLRSSKKEEPVSSISTLNQIPEDTNAGVPIKGKVTRGRTKKLQVQVPEDPEPDKGKPADIVVPVDGRKTRRGRKVSPIEPEPLIELQQTTESVQVPVTEEPTSTQQDHDQNQDPVVSNNEYAEDHVAEGLVKETSVDTSRWEDLEKMTLGDFFDYLEWYLPKEIREKTEEIISQLPEKTRKFHEVKLQRNENDKGKQAID